MTIKYSYRSARPEDLDDLLRLFPQLADFEVPIRRVARHLWEGDEQLLRSVLAKESKATFADVVVDQENTIQGVIMVTMRAELLSHDPSAHLETIIVAPEVRGQGLGHRLLERAERKAAELGAKSLSLHVFSNNLRARALYRRHGFEEELLRCIKWLSPPA